MNVQYCIAGLLAEHDCVIIPGFGGFIGNYAPARIDPVHHSFQPPSKKLLFNINLRQNDGLLANRVAEAFGTSYVDACRLVDEWVSECRQELKSGKSFVIPSVGKLFAGREGNIQFEQDKSTNLLPDAFGLTTFISPPISRTTPNIRIDRRPPVTQKKSTPPSYVFPRPLKWAALIAIPIGTAAIIGVTQYDKLKSSDVSNAGIFSSVFSRFSSTSLVERKEAPATPQENLYQFEPAPSAFDEPVENGQQKSDEYTEPVNTTSNEVIQSEVQEKKQDAAVPEGSSDAPFAIIIGAFKVRENAERLVMDLKNRGKEASIYDRSRTGLYRVSIGNYSSKVEAEQALAQVKNEDFSGAWLLAK